MAATAKKITEEAPKVEIKPSRRFYLPDIADRGRFLIERLRPKYPHLQDNQIAGWLRGLMDSSECCFLIAGHTVCLFQSIHDSLSARPTVIERFVLLEDMAYLEEALNMYEDAHRWAFQIGADRMIIGQFSDVPKEVASQKIGPLFKEETYFVKVGQ